MAELRIRKLVADRRFLLGVTFAAAILAFAGPLMAYDLWWHLKAAGLILKEHCVPHADPFSFTALGRPWTYHSWLSGVALLGVWRLAGPVGVILFRALLIALSLMLSWGVARQRGVGAGLASVLVLAACLQLELRALARPYLFSFVFFMLFFLILDRASRGTASPGDGGGRWRAERRLLWGRDGRLMLLPLITLVWVNMHAGFLSGLLVLGAYGAGEMVRVAAIRGGKPYLSALLRGHQGARFRAMFASGVLCLLASLVTPYGPGTLLYAFRLMGQVRLVKQIQEWQPMPMTAHFAVFWAMLVIGGLLVLRSAVLSAGSGRLREEVGRLVTDVLLMGGFAYLAVGAVRHMAWCLLLAPAIVGYHVSVARHAVGAEEQERPIYAYAALVLAFVIGPWPFLSSGPPRLVVSERHTPVKACDFMAANGLLDTIYNSYEWGGYLTWRFWPELKVFIDGRCLVYGDEIIGQALAVEKAQDGWRDVFERWDIRLFLVRYGKKDCAHLLSDPRWRCVYWDDLAMIGLRDDALAERGGGLRTFPLSNPAAFEQSLEQQPVADILAELEDVLRRDPECWTALTYRARCLVRQAREAGQGKDELLRMALGVAQRAVALQETHEAWSAVAEAASALGEAELADQASARAAKLKPAKRP